MKKLTLAPEQLLATDTSFPEDNLAFQIYYHVIANGGEDSLPPIIVGTINSPSEWKTKLEVRYGPWAQKKPELIEWRRKEYNILFRMLRNVPYFILDGNHRALAAALNRRAINALQIELDSDLDQVARMVLTGELLSFPHAGRSVERIEGRAIQHFLNLTDIPPNHGLNASMKVNIAPLVPMKTRAYDLVTSKKLPAYMIKNYSARKEGRPIILPNQPRLSW